MDVSSFSLKSNLASLKTELDILDIDKLTPVPNDLAKLSNVVKNDVVKKTEYNKLVTKVDNIDTRNFVKKTKYEKDGSDFEDKIRKTDNKIPDASGLVKKSALAAVESKIPDVSSLATKSALIVVENKIPDVSSLVKKTEYNKLVTEVDNIDTPDFVKNTHYATKITKIKNDYVTNAALDARHKDLVQKII